MPATVTAPTPNGVFQVSSGVRYISDVNGVIANVPFGRDLLDLITGGCFISAVSETMNNLTLTGLLFESAQVGIVASITRTQAGATVLVKEVNRVDTSTAPAVGTVLGDGVALMASGAGLDVCLINNTVNIITVYPFGADQINGLGAGVGIPIPPGDVAQFECAAAGDWRVEAGVGTSGLFDTVISCDNIAAAGTSQATAPLLPAVISRIVSGSGGVRLPGAVAGLDILIINHTGAPVQIYASGGDLIDDIAGSVGVAQMNGSLCLFACAANGNWYSNGIGTGYAGAYPTISYTNGVTALAGGGQAGAVLLTTALTRVTTVATAGDSVKLPLAVGGMQITALNAGANALNVFPAVGDAVNALGANAAYGLAAGKTASFFSTVAGFWHVLLSA